MQKKLEVDLSDPSNEDTIKFLNLIDPLLWSAFVSKVKNTDNKKSIQELFEELLEGR